MLVGELINLERDLKDEDNKKDATKQVEIQKNKQAKTLVKNVAGGVHSITHQSAAPALKKRRVNVESTGPSNSGAEKQFTKGGNVLFFLKNFKDEMENVIDTEVKYKQLDSAYHMEDKLDSIEKSNNRIADTLEWLAGAVMNMNDMLQQLLAAITHQPSL
ncbi:hypothetical protein J3Q64DRAFT_1837609 [Phycomyces blakesleeanus]|uniref:Uncharacterized protein n=2 Tax=Phycomyces blakesleeanus TaxID=4837 RepID=A0A162N2X8_PHYB8|nr:hypothetical protein PHYBLDRAFT_176239 [Phycomyces blakesleeanus NRRL 1555(-)]OAD65324.1 hypothetical protein PHYBLDRAFT_176239 [Phycomyces blakesleeanus NRRL 1555(-)]|eukprot:XP_018283364.1 hypothetical protein PHYBLDRAFT_176239 [Phycomyces blakesleeanus NRRL 1555(-)]